MEIERKYLIDQVPVDLSNYKSRKIEQGYLSTEPVVRVRRDNDEYVLTYKSKGLMVREEYNLPLTKESYEHLREKVDGRIIAKTRYEIPLADQLDMDIADSDRTASDFKQFIPEYAKLTIELDIFEDDLAPLKLAEVEFPNEELANAFIPPKWFGEDVTFSSDYHNSTLSQK